jgi:hypothetical protein
MNFPDRVPGIPDFTPIFDLIREERILSTILGYGIPWTCGSNSYKMPPFFPKFA